MSVREAAEALLAYMDIDSGALNHHDRMEALRAALAEPEPVTADAMLEAMREAAMIGNTGTYETVCEIDMTSAGEWSVMVDRTVLNDHSTMEEGETNADAIMRVLCEQAIGAREGGE
jgi:hypothetical protein